MPSAVGDFLILDCLRESQGAAIAVPERELVAMQRRMAAAGAGYLSLETAAAASAVPMLVELRKIDPGEVVVVFDTGAGFKSVPPGDLAAPIHAANVPGGWDEVVSQLAK